LTQGASIFYPLPIACCLNSKERNDNSNSSLKGNAARCESAWNVTLAIMAAEDRAPFLKPGPSRLDVIQKFQFGGIDSFMPMTSTCCWSRPTAEEAGALLNLCLTTTGSSRWQGPPLRKGKDVESQTTD